MTRLSLGLGLGMGFDNISESILEQLLKTSPVALYSGLSSDGLQIVDRVGGLNATLLNSCCGYPAGGNYDNFTSSVGIFNTSNHSFYLDFWMQANNLDSDPEYRTNRYIWTERSSTTTNTYFAIKSKRLSNKLEIYIKNDAGTVLLDGASNSVVCDGNVHHVVLNGLNGTITITIDGVLDKTLNYTPSGVMSLNQFYLFGNPRSDILYNFPGKFWNFKSNYFNYPMAEGRKVLLYDVSGNGRHLNFDSRFSGFYSNTQNLFHYNISHGFTWSNWCRIPASLIDPTKDVLGNTLSNPPVATSGVHNGAETLLMLPDNASLKNADNRYLFYNLDGNQNLIFNDMLDKNYGNENKIFTNTSNSLKDNMIIYSTPKSGSELVKIQSLLNTSRSKYHNYLEQNGIILNTCENTSDWVNIANASISTSTTYRLENNSIFIRDSGTGNLVSAQINSNFEASIIDTFFVDMFNAYAYENLASSIKVDISSESTTDALTNYASYTVNISSPDNNIFVKDNGGWTKLAIQKNDFTVYGSFDFNTDTVRTVRISVQSKSGQKGQLILDRISINQKSTSIVLVQFDDSLESVYTNAYPIMRDRGIVGTCYVLPQSIGTAGCMTLSQLQELRDAGWAIASHYWTHTDMRSDDLATQTSKIALARDWLINNNFGEGAYHIAYPYGYWNDNTLAAVTACGLKTGRVTIPQGPQVIPIDEKRKLVPYSLDSGTLNLNTLINTVFPRALKHGQTIILYGHSILPSGGSMTPTTLTTICDAIVSNGFTNKNIITWYSGLNYNTGIY